MGSYQRSTKECAFDQLRPELVQAIREYIQNQRLGGIEWDVLGCCETVSEKKHTGKLTSLLEGDLDTLAYTGILVTPQWLIWARSGDKSGLKVFSANLKNVRVKISDSNLIKDTKLEVVGYIGDSPERVRGYIGLGPEEAAQKFCEEVKKAAEKYRKEAPPARRRIKLGWW